MREIQSVYCEVELTNYIHGAQSLFKTCQLHSVWDLFRTNWNWDRFLSMQVYFCFPLAASIHHCFTFVFIFFKRSNVSADVRQQCKEEWAYA